MTIRRSSIVSKPHVRSSICAARGGGRRALPVVQCFHLGLFLLLFAGRPVSAGPNEGGTLIVHRDPSLIYTAEQDYCGQSDLGNCEDAVVSAPADPESVVVFHLLAAFPADSSPRLKGLSFGIEYDTARLSLVAHGPCIGDLDNGAMEYPGERRRCRTCRLSYQACRHHRSEWGRSCSRAVSRTRAVSG